MDAFELEVLSPTGLATSGKVREVVLPAWNGEVGILPNHVPYTALLGTGVIRFDSIQSGPVSLVVSEGFCVFSDHTLKVLADKVMLPEAFIAEHGGKTAAVEFIRSRCNELDSKMNVLSVDSHQWKDANQEFLALKAMIPCLEASH